MTNKERYYLNKIDATINKGSFSCRGEGVKWLIGFVAIVSMCGSIVIVVYATLNFPNSSYETEDLVLSIFGSIILFGLSICGILAVWLINRQVKTILMWLGDAVELDAYVKKLDAVPIEVHPLLPSKHCECKVRIHFKYDGKKHIKDSKNYHQVWEKYIDQNVKILYSPKYDEVMILRPDKINGVYTN